MDIASLSIVNKYSFGQTFNEIVPFKSSCSSSPHTDVSITDLADTPAKNSIANEDALQAVKLDPAVLEVQVTYKTKQNRKLSDDRSPVMFRGKALVDRTAEARFHTSFKEAVSQTQAALLSLSPEQYDLLLAYVATLRRQRTAQQTALECAFCKNNGEPLSWYSAHALKDWRGRVLCPVLRAFRCPRCGATGDRAHTIKYCPANADAVVCYLNTKEEFTRTAFGRKLAPKMDRNADGAAQVIALLQSRIRQFDAA